MLLKNDSKCKEKEKKAMNSGTSLFKVSKLLGHSSTKMTEKYAHTDVENLRVDIKKLSLNSEQTVNSKIIDIKISNNIR